MASHSPKPALYQRAETQMAGRLGRPGSVATGGTEATTAGRRSAGKGKESLKTQIRIKIVFLLPQNLLPNAPLQRQNHRYPESAAHRPLRALRKPHRTRVRGAGGRHVDCRGRAETRGALRQRVGVDAVVRGGTRRRPRQLLRRLDEEPLLRNDQLQRRLPPRELPAGKMRGGMLAICDVRCAMCDVRFTTYDLRFTTYDLRFKVYGLRSKVSSFKFQVSSLKS